MSFYSNIYKDFILPLSDSVTKWNISKSLKFLKESQWWSKDDLEDFQKKRLRLLIDHAYGNVPYYKELFDKHDINPKSIREIADLKNIPILTKEIVIENFNNGKLLAKNARKNQYIFKQSSGSTGLKTTFNISKEAYGFNIACNLRGWDWMGYEIGDKILKVSQNKRYSSLKKIQDKIDRTYLFYQTYDQKNIISFYNSLLSYKPKYIRSYPDPLLFLCSSMKKNNLKLPVISAINTTGNILFPEARSIIEDTLSCKIFDSYSCEGGANFFECSTHEAYHSSMEYAITEIINSEGQEVKNGESGKHITTDLWNFAMPFIRYDSKDIIEKSQYECSCKRGLLSFSKIIGRDNDIIITPNGEFLIAQSFTTYFKYFPSVLQFQVYQESLNHIEFRLKVNEFFNESVSTEIQKHWETQFGDNVKILIKIYDDIPLLDSGKNRFLIRNKSIKLNL